jgi:hypothetical protein
MWNKLAPALAGGVPPRPGMPQQAAAPMPGAPAPVAEAAPSGPQMPAEFQQHVDPNNQMQATLIQRGHQLQPQESQAFAAGIDVPALNVLKKLVPELGFLWDKIIQLKGQAGAAPPGGTPPVPGAPPLPGAPPAAAAGPPTPPPSRLTMQRFQ